MKLFNTGLMDLFATWASAGQFESANELADADLRKPAAKVSQLPGAAKARAKRTQQIALNPVQEVDYFAGPIRMSGKHG